MRDITYFGQSPNLAGNEYVSYPINSATDAQNFGNHVRSSIPSSQVEYGKRRMLKWMVPERGVVEMYINPQNISIKHSKNIKSERSKGGFITQYWGEELIAITITGHTGSSGIEGINVLYDIYRGEQVAFDVIALEALAKSKNEDEEYLTALVPGLGQITDFMKDLGEQMQGTGLSIPKPTLGFYASTVEFFWMGEVYRGFFDGFGVTENAESLGIFNYDISFKATQKRGVRTNYLPWQHPATSGPSDHQAVPYTFNNQIFEKDTITSEMGKKFAGIK